MPATAPSTTLVWMLLVAEGEEVDLAEALVTFGAVLVVAGTVLRKDEVVDSTTNEVDVEGGGEEDAEDGIKI